MKQMNVFPECYVDTNLVGHILGCKVKHKSTCNEVAKAVNNADCFAIGIIDADKRLATMDDGFYVLTRSSEADGTNKHITMYAHKDGKRFMFTIKPAMDKFILDAATSQNVDLEKLGYPSSLEGFKKQTKRIQAAEDSKLRQLFDMIGDYPELQQFRNTLKYLVKKQYAIDVDVARQFFDGMMTKDDLVAILQSN
ncbi:MAG: hypothetical protein IKP73_20485 [Bacteroidales bacterium]|nr:hypothetical protein [Bacteroidales bacterium]MBR4625949.1 hypothetical protein [Alphaproteobacteria bacterium]